MVKQVIWTAAFFLLHRVIGMIVYTHCSLMNIIEFFYNMMECTISMHTMLFDLNLKLHHTFKRELKAAWQAEP